LQLTSSTHSAFAALGALEGAVYLLRPDGHVAARWKHPQPGMLAQAIERAACLRATVEEIV
jgi:3-(3-hydroxy-phenyl)propionate hydroxylase